MPTLMVSVLMSVHLGQEERLLRILQWKYTTRQQRVASKAPNMMMMDVNAKKKLLFVRDILLHRPQKRNFA
jgi:hypothetical protein